MSPTPVEKARRILRIVVFVMPIILVLGVWLTRGKPLGPRLVGAAVNISLTVWFMVLLRKTIHTKTATEIADLIERFLNKVSLYPQEWNDFVECRHPDKFLDSYRKRCDLLDPRDPKALEELRNMVQELRTFSTPV
jgi:hypothetical protein